MIGFIRHIQRSARNYLQKADEGNVTMEFVIGLPLILVAFVMVFEFSSLFWAHHIATNNVRSAVRYLSRAPLTAPYITNATNLAKTGDPDDATGARNWMSAVDVDVNTSFSTFSSSDFRNNGQVIRIQADVPFGVGFFGMMNAFTGGDIPLAMTFSITEQARYIGE